MIDIDTYIMHMLTNPYLLVEDEIKCPQMAIPLLCEHTLAKSCTSSWIFSDGSVLAE
jgi:hypothetical protein